jgi:DNA adenine methylase
MLEKASSVLKTARLIHSDVEPILDKAGKGDVVYCDPTYTVAHENNGFVRYNERNFSWQDQERLRSASHAAAHRGAVVLISNAHHSCIRRLYEPAKFKTLHRISTISRDPNKRRAISEYLIVLCPDGYE